VAKFRDQSGAQRLWRATGLRVDPPWRLLPAVELLVGGAVLVSAPGSWFLAAAVLALMTGVLWRATVRGYDKKCGCFGALDALPAGRQLVIRNLLLGSLAVGGFAASRICGDSPFWMQSNGALLSAFAVAGAAAIAYASWSYAELLRGRRDPT
jgi:hypothetical protein